MFADEFDDFGDAPHHPSRDCFGIIPNDSTELATVPKAIYVGTGGDVMVRTFASAVDVLFANVPGGTILPIRVSAVRAAGTTARDIVGMA